MSNEVLRVPLSSIKETPENWDIYTRPEADDQFPALVDSVLKNGVLEPITISSDRFILSGHRRHAAARRAYDRDPMNFHPAVPIIVMDDIMIGPMSPEERVKILIAHNKGSRVKTTFEGIAETMAMVDASAAIAIAQNRKSQVYALAQTSHEMVDATEGSRRTNPLKQRGELLAAVQTIIADLRKNKLLPTSARHIHYRLLSVGPLTSKGKKGHRYGTESGDAEKLGKLLTDARSAGLVSDDCIVDETRPDYVASFYCSVSEYVAAEVDGLFQGYISNIHRDQPSHIEIVVEKNTIFPLLRSRVAGPLRITISSARGYLSYPAGCKMVKRFRKSGKERFIIIYVSDHDPEGMDMPAAFKKYLLEDHNVDVEVVRAAVTDEQIDKYNLPPDADANADSSRYDKYVEQYGEKVWELDSMNMESLSEEVRQACLSFMDVDALNAAFEREREDDVRLARLNAAVAKIIPSLLHQLEQSNQ